MLENRCDCAPQNQDLVDTVKNSLPNFDEIMDLSDFFKVMSDDPTSITNFFTALRNVRI